MIAGCGLLLALTGITAWLLNSPPALALFDGLHWPGGTPVTATAKPPLKVTFLGVASVLFDDGETALLTDGFFSRPDKMQTFLGQIEPDLQAITNGLRRAGIPDQTGKLAVVIPLHSHYDHAMDAPEVAKRTGAWLLGSESTAMVGRGWGLSESQIHIAVLGKPTTFGRFTVTLLAGAHSPTGFTGGEILEPLTPPVRASDYKEGQSYAALVQHDGRSILVTGSAGFVPGALQGVRADVVLLGIGALGMRSDAFRSDYWREVVGSVHAQRVIPIHWDDFWVASTLPMQPMPVPLDRFEVSMLFLQQQAKHDAVDLRLPLEWKAMDVFEGLKPRSP